MYFCWFGSAGAWPECAPVQIVRRAPGIGPCGERVRDQNAVLGVETQRTPVEQFVMQGGFKW
jgi:hypothetical protein